MLKQNSVFGIEFDLKSAEPSLNTNRNDLGKLDVSSASLQFGIEAGSLPHPLVTIGGGQNHARAAASGVGHTSIALHFRHNQTSSPARAGRRRLFFRHAKAL